MRVLLSLLLVVVLLGLAGRYLAHQAAVHQEMQAAARANMQRYMSRDSARRAFEYDSAVKAAAENRARGQATRDSMAEHTRCELERARERNVTHLVPCPPKPSYEGSRKIK